MSMKTIEVPDYVSDEFDRPLSHPSKRANAINLSIDRVYHLAAEALKGLEWPDWEIEGQNYHSLNNVEPYGFERVGSRFYIYLEQRGRKMPIAVFKSYYMAADYFVWLVSKGMRAIQWDSFMDMEP